MTSMDPYRTLVDASQKRSVIIEAPITHVTLLEDRAVVTRTFRVSLEAGETELVVEGVSPIAIDKTLICASKPRVTVADARVDRAPVTDARDVPTDVRELDLAVRAAEDKARDARAHERAKHDEAARLREVLELHVNELAEDASAGVGAQSGAATLLELALAVRKSVSVAALLGHEASHLERELEARERLRDEASRPTVTETARIRVTVTTEDALVFESTVRYVVPNACWRPSYRAALDEGTLRVEAQATVWQNTGEPWTNAMLSFSTERPSLGSAEPTLTADVLRARPKRPLVIETREQSIDELEGSSGLSSEVPGIDDGGTAQLLKTPKGVDVPSSGRPIRLDLFAFAPTVELDHIATPELVAAVILRARASNEAAHVLLAGPVELVRAGEIIGRGKLPFVGVGERFSLGFGPHPGIFIAREIVQQPDKTSLLGGWTTRVFDVRLRITNLGGESVTFAVEERVAISEVEKVKVAAMIEDTTDNKAPDANGFVRWSVVLPPHARRVLQLRISERRHADAGGE